MSDCCSPQLMAEAATLDAAMLLGTGLVISLGHCLGMCGPLLGAYSVAQRQEGQGTWAALPALLPYHGGRLLSYTLIGLALGLVGSAARLGGNPRALQGALSLLVGALMIVLSLGLAGWLPVARRVESVRWGEAVVARMRRLLGSRRFGGRWLLGMGNGLLPCGPVYAMALSTLAAASAWRGALAMLLFGAATLPMLLAFGLGASRLAPVARDRLARIGAFLVLLIGVQLALRGAAAFGWVGHLKLGPVVIW